MEYKHVPVMLDRVLEYLAPRQGGKYIDCTMGGGGYSIAIAKIAGPQGIVLAIDQDEMAILNMRAEIKKRKLTNIKINHGNFRDLSKIIQEEFEEDEAVRFDGIVYDLGLSSAQLEDRSRGFSFKLAESPLVMSFGSEGAETAAKIINGWEAKDIEKILYEYGEERFAKRITAKIIEARQAEAVNTVGQLVEIIKSAVPAAYQHSKLNPATKTFQALRLASNQELSSLEKSLPQAMEALAQAGRIAAVAYHSLEDRIVKNFYKQESQGCICPPRFPICQCGHLAGLRIITKKPILPVEDEIKRNPRARSAKLRVAEKI